MLSNRQRGMQVTHLLERKLASLYAIAPILLSMGLSLGHFSHWSVSLGACLSLFLAFRFGFLGFFTSSALWMTLFAFQTPLFWTDKTQLALAGSVVCSAWMASLCFREAKDLFSSLERKEHELILQSDELEKQLKEAQLLVREEKKEKEKQQLRLEQQVEEYKIQVTSHRHHLALAWQESSQLKEDHEKAIQELKTENLALKEKADSRLEELQNIERAFKEKADLHLVELQNLEKALKEKTENHHQQIQALEASLKESTELHERYKQEIAKKEEERLAAMAQQAVALQEGEGTQESIKNWENLYKQLRLQFDEKTEVLNQTRKEFFRIENQCLSLQKEKEEFARVESEEEASLILLLKNLEEECQDLEAQVLFLQDVISSLSEKKKVARPKRTKKSSDPVSALDQMIESKIQLQENLF